MNIKLKNFLLARLRFLVGWISIIIVSATALTLIMYFIQPSEDEAEVDDTSDYVKMKQEIMDSYGDYPPVMGYIKSGNLGNRSLTFENFDNFIDVYYWDESTDCVIAGIQPNCEDTEACEFVEENCDIQEIDDLLSEYSDYPVSIIPNVGNKIKSIIFSNGLYGM